MIQQPLRAPRCSTCHALLVQRYMWRQDKQYIELLCPFCDRARLDNCWRWRTKKTRHAHGKET